MRGEVSYERQASARSESTHLEVLSDFTDKSLEGELADEKLCRLLVATDFTESDGSGAETMGLLHATCRCLGRQ